MTETWSSQSSHIDFYTAETDQEIIDHAGSLGNHDPVLARSEFALRERFCSENGFHLIGFVPLDSKREMTIFTACALYLHQDNDRKVKYENAGIQIEAVVSEFGNGVYIYWGPSEIARGTKLQSDNARPPQEIVHTVLDLFGQDLKDIYSEMFT